MKKIFHLFIFFLLTSSAQSFAGSDGYICTILQIQELNSSGKFVAYEGVLYSTLLGESFSVDRDTGKINGSPFSTKHYKEVRVLDRGSTENAYKEIIISHPPNIWIMYVYVKEFESGPEKPFWGTEDGNKIFSGICK